MILNGFKVCRVRDASYYSTKMMSNTHPLGLYPRPDTVKYVMGEWVYPKNGFDELSVFTSYDYAKLFTWNMTDTVILSCEYEPVSWWRHLRLILGRYKGSPQGKVFAKRVKVLQEVGT